MEKLHEKQFHYIFIYKHIQCTPRFKVALKMNLPPKKKKKHETCQTLSKTHVKCNLWGLCIGFTKLKSHPFGNKVTLTPRDSNGMMRRFS